MSHAPPRATTPPALAPDRTGAPAGTVRLITDADDPARPTIDRETDAHGALTRGLAEYLQQLAIAMGGRELRLVQVRTDWATPDDQAVYPSAAVYSVDDGVYSADGFTPQTSGVHFTPPGADRPVYLVSTAELVLPITVEVWAETQEDRSALVAMLEDALDPVDWRSGLLLELPFYFGERATYLKTNVRYADTEEKAGQRIRIAGLTIVGTVPVTKLVPFTQSRLPVATLDQISPDVLDRR